MNRQFLVSAFLDSARVWLVLGPILLLIALVYFLLFVVFPNTDKRFRRASAICMPVGLLLIVIDALFPLDPYTFRGFDSFVFAVVLILFTAPFLVKRSPHESSKGLHGRIRLVAAILPALGTFSIGRYWPEFWHTQLFVFALIAYGTFVIASALVRWQSGPRVR